MQSSRYSGRPQGRFRRALQQSFILIISIWIGTVQGRAQTPDAETVLRQRVAAYWDAMQRNDYEAASNYVHPDSRKQFIYRVPRGAIVRWKIEKLTFNADKTECNISMLVGRPIPIPIGKAGEVPDLPLENRWVLLQDGAWYLILPWKEGENPLLTLYLAMEDSKSTLVTDGVTSASRPKPATPPPSRLQPDPKNPEVLHRGEKAVFRFHYLNSGEVPFKIFSAEGDCHCTSVQADHPVVEPGKSGTLEVTVDTFGLAYGWTNKLVSVKFSDLVKPLELSIQFNNVPNFMIAPPSVDFGAIPMGKPVEKKVRIVNESGRTVKFLSVFNSESRLTLSMDRTEVGPGETMILTIRCNPNEAGEFADRPMLRTDLEAEPMFNISIRGKITP